jgi:hypothetical protein
MEFTYNTFSVSWPMSSICPLFIGSFALNMVYSLLAIWRMNRVNLRIPLVIVFLFPYYLLTLTFFVIPLLLELNPLKAKGGHVNIWEKNR